MNSLRTSNVLSDVLPSTVNNEQFESKYGYGEKNQRKHVLPEPSWHTPANRGLAMRGALALGTLALGIPTIGMAALVVAVTGTALTGILASAVLVMGLIKVCRKCLGQVFFAAK
ncbi:MAG: hypothetical protein LBK24_01405 [Puniceicoccales bacterium]|jgi:hypothetical protein|nr:hypothetical protein [Puniceicoccales bacterium]